MQNINSQQQEMFRIIIVWDRTGDQKRVEQEPINFFSMNKKLGLCRKNQLTTFSSSNLQEHVVRADSLTIGKILGSIVADTSNTRVKSKLKFQVQENWNFQKSKTRTSGFQNQNFRFWSRNANKYSETIANDLQNHEI